MSRASKIEFIGLHCRAGYGPIESMEAWWRTPKEQGGPGWKAKGYHIYIELDGTTWYLKDNFATNGYSKNPEDLNLELITNGIASYNTRCIHICLEGGVERDNVRVPKDTRTPDQEHSLGLEITRCIKWLASKGKDVTKKLGVYGHWDFSPDKDGSGVIEKWERIKECPGWEVMKSTYHFLYSSKDRYGKLPYIN